MRFLGETTVTLSCLKSGLSSTLTATNLPVTSLAVKRRSITFSMRDVAVIKRIFRLPFKL